MSEESTARMHWSFWAIGIVALIWNALGVLNFLLQMNPSMLAEYRESERLIIEGRPAWASAAFALAVFSGTLGCVLLLLRKSAAYPMFVASLVGVIVTMAHALGSGVGFEMEELIGIVVMPLIVAALLVRYAGKAKTKGWIS